ncbi:hypothetical protein [Streptomyces profundus]|uniref:hypothetical protein n=1 Tax=Streptomyces profundus TaxID=2867410 RepID=UPI001D160A00|nr:hypothetical protein [Streptomyces sp. MA3_2.13]UED86948.1 hypothetical protein K4G22_24365 [Streptomyces sp. MA3_2.13]
MSDAPEPMGSHFQGDPWHDDYGVLPAPTRRRPSGARLAGSILVTLVVISGLVGALLLATPALDTEDRGVPEAPEAAETR